jgi:hypothetical protein
MDSIQPIQPAVSQPPAMPIPSSQNLPEWNRPPIANDKNMDKKKQLLQRLMSDLMNKPGRSVNEMINGVKSVLSTYKSYAKELDTLDGAQQAGSPASGTASSGDIQSILRGIQQKKAGTPSVPGQQPGNGI